MSSSSKPLRDAAATIASLPLPALFALLFVAVALSHVTLLHLPYYWDEGGYYIPAALDFYHTGQIIPHYTNAHTPLPNILLGTLWHIVGYHILATRLFICAMAATALAAVFRLAQRLLDPSAAVVATFLTAVYPIWFAQSTLAHADIFAAAFTLCALALYLPARSGAARQELPKARPQHRIAVSALFCLAVLSKETSIVNPAALAALELFLLLRYRSHASARRDHLAWLAALSFPLLPLIAWFAYHHHVTGFTFGNPQYLRYNATANLTAAHISQALRYRFVHLFWQRDIWLPILLAFACLFLPRRVAVPNGFSAVHNGFSAVPDAFFAAHPLPSGRHAPVTASAISGLASGTLRDIAVLVLANWLAFSVLGGALLTRYLLPVYPLILLVCIDVWRSRISLWPIFGVLTAAAFISALWLNPPTFFAPEDNLAYRDMTVVHQQAIAFVEQHYPNARVLTAWPVTTDLFLPELGYVNHSMKPVAIDDFTLPQIRKAAQEPGRYDTAIVFTTHFVAPSFRRYLLSHPDTPRGRQFAETRDLSPAEIASLLGGQIVWQKNINGEWAAVLRFNRSYNATLLSPFVRPYFFQNLPG